VTDEGRGWVLVLPDPDGALTHLWAEGADDDAAQSLLDEWGAIVEQASAHSDTSLCPLAGADLRGAWTTVPRHG
jgi:hypothetical protein